MRNITTPLTTGWQVAERVAPSRDLLFLAGGERDWVPATVPGHVHLDLVRAGVIPDPFFRMQERSCRWVDEADWTYRTTFTVNAERLAARGDYGRHFLHFHGLDTLARVYLNGSLVGTAENMFVPHRFDVTDALREGDNDLRVEFDSALRVGQERAAAYLGDAAFGDRGEQGYFNFGPRAFVRKAQYMFGWDWGPELVSCGIWQPVELVTVPVAEIVDRRVEHEFIAENRVRVVVVVDVERHQPDIPVRFDARLTADLGFPDLFKEAEEIHLSDQIPLPPSVGRHSLRAELGEATIARWQCGLNASAIRYLVTASLTLSDPKKEEYRFLHSIAWRIGFRMVELVREPDTDGKGEGFLFRVNGVDTYIKGANWIPDHSFPSLIDRKRLEKRLRQAKDAGFNMLRVWGGGLYESDDFYDICDDLGILVWQDFPFACCLYPDDDPSFLENVRAEATAAVRRLRHHPCLALWCGGNENVELHQYRWEGDSQATKFYGEHLVGELLPAVLAAEDPKTPYWPNSPFSGESCEMCRDESYGDAHYWAVWHSHGGTTGDWVHYAESDCRFSSEFGFAAPCGWNAWESCTDPADRWPGSPVARWHDKTRKGYDTYIGYVEKHFPRVNSFDDLIYYGQANQALALSFGIEHWRRAKGRCWGTLFWQFNDCWPVQSWSVVDGAGEEKLAYYAVKRAYAPLLLSLYSADGRAAAAHLVNDTLQPVPGILTLRLLDFYGTEIARRENRVIAPANAASGAAVTLEMPERTDTSAVFLHATFTAPDGALLAERMALLAEPKDLRLPAPGLSWGLTPSPKANEPAWSLEFRAERLAAFVWLRFEGMTGVTFSDNGFHLAPGQTRPVEVHGLSRDVAPGELLARLRVRHL